MQKRGSRASQKEAPKGRPWVAGRHQFCGCCWSDVAVQDRNDLALKLSRWFLDSSFFLFSSLLQVLLCAHVRAPESCELKDPVLLMRICLPACLLAFIDIPWAAKSTWATSTPFQAPGPLISISCHGCFSLSYILSVLDVVLLLRVCLQSGQS